MCVPNNFCLKPLSFSAKYYHKHKIFMENIRYSLSILIKFEISLQLFKKILIYKISWKPAQWGPSSFIRTDRETNGHDMTRHFFPNFMQSVTHNYISRRMRRTERAASMSEVRNASNVIIKSRELEKQLEMRTCRLEVNMKMASG